MLTSACPASRPIDFYVQALDSGGHVAVSSNKGANFESLPAAPPTITANGERDANGWFTGPVQVAAAPFAAGPVDVTVNGVPASSPLTLTDDGAYEVVATTPGGPSSSEVVRIDAGAPTVSATTSVPSPANGPVTVELLGTDAGIGVAAITWSTTGAETTGPVTTPGATVDVYGIGGEYARFLPRYTLAGRVSYSSVDDTDVDAWGLSGEYRLFSSDNLRFDLGAGLSLNDADDAVVLAAAPNTASAILRSAWAAGSVGSTPTMTTRRPSALRRASTSATARSRLATAAATRSAPLAA